MLAVATWITRAAPRDHHHRLAQAIAALLLVQEAAKLYFFIGINDLPWQRHLPLDLCRINEFVCVYMLARRSFRAFEVAYFWAMGGSAMAMITPDLAQSFPDPRFLLFFLGHGLVLLATLYAIFAYHFRPSLGSVARTLAISGVYAVIVSGLNYLLDANYLFLRAKPQGASVLDYLGPWPVYIFGLCALATVISLACYAPFALARRCRE
jgi:hypothetical integral membrane protein (TIGR02206 family)